MKLISWIGFKPASIESYDAKSPVTLPMIRVLFGDLIALSQKVPWCLKIPRNGPKNKVPWNCRTYPVSLSFYTYLLCHKIKSQRNQKFWGIHHLETKLKSLGENWNHLERKEIKKMKTMRMKTTNLILQSIHFDSRHSFPIRF